MRMRNEMEYPVSKWKILRFLDENCFFQYCSTKQTTPPCGIFWDYSKDKSYFFMVRPPFWVVK